MVGAGARLGLGTARLAALAAGVERVVVDIHEIAIEAVNIRQLVIRRLRVGQGEASGERLAETLLPL